MSTDTEVSGESGLTAATLVAMLRGLAECHGDKVALRFSWNGDGEGGSQLTYHELDVRARAIAAGLQQLGATGHRALVFYRPGLDFITGFFGCLYAGVAAVPVHVRMGSRLAAVVPDARARFALAIAATQANRRAEVDALLDGQSLQWYTTDEAVGDPESWVPPDVGPDTTAMIQYTSGTTTAPKGVVLTHRNLLHNVAVMRRLWNLNDQTLGVYWLPLHHDMGLIGTVLAPLSVAGSVVFMAPAAFIEQPTRWLDALSRHHATATAAPNFAFDLCVESTTPEERAALDLSGLVSMVSGGDMVRAATLRSFISAFAPAGLPPAAVVPAYGLAEATLVVSGGSTTAPPTVRYLDRTALGQSRVVETDVPSPGYGHVVELVGCGRPHADQRVAFVDPETGKRCGADEVGEIWVAGTSISQGYWHRPEETGQNFSAYLAEAGADQFRGPFLRTGDLGFLSDGELFVTGRYEDLIVIGGRYYYPNDIEVTVQACDPVLASERGAVFAVAPEASESGADEQIVAVQELDPRRIGDTDLAAVTAAIRAAIKQDHGVDARTVVLVEFMSLPTTSSGKIRRRQCRRQFLDGTLKVVADRP